jgi:hypothetical protein
MRAGPEALFGRANVIAPTREAMEQRDDGATARDPSRHPARALLERELSQAAPPGASAESGPWRQWATLLDSLRAQLPRPVPADPALDTGSRLKRAYRRFVHRLGRPVSRRSERIAGDLAELGMQLAQQVERIELRVESLREGNQATRGKLGALETRLTEMAAEVRTLTAQLSSLSSSLSAEVAAVAAVSRRARSEETSGVSADTGGPSE